MKYGFASDLPQSLDQLRFDPWTGKYSRLAPSNKFTDNLLTGCPVRWFKYDGGQYRCVDGGSGEDATGCFKAIDVTALPIIRQ